MWVVVGARRKSHPPDVSHGGRIFIQALAVWSVRFGTFRLSLQQLEFSNTSLAISVWRFYLSNFNLCSDFSSATLTQPFLFSYFGNLAQLLELHDVSLAVFAAQLQFGFPLETLAWEFSFGSFLSVAFAQFFFCREPPFGMFGLEPGVRGSGLDDFRLRALAWGTWLGNVRLGLENCRLKAIA